MAYFPGMERPASCLETPVRNSCTDLHIKFYDITGVEKYKVDLVNISLAQRWKPLLSKWFLYKQATTGSDGNGVGRGLLKRFPYLKVYLKPEKQNN